MPTSAALIDELIAKLLCLHEAHQKTAIYALREIVEAPYVLSEAELHVLRPALDDARLGKQLFDADADELLTKPWG